MLHLSGPIANTRLLLELKISSTFNQELNSTFLNFLAAGRNKFLMPSDP
jgi:hypothetical protein